MLSRKLPADRVRIVGWEFLCEKIAVGKNINTDSGGLKADGLNHIIIESYDYGITELMWGCRLCGDGVEAFAEPAVD